MHQLHQCSSPELQNTPLPIQRAVFVFTFPFSRVIEVVSRTTFKMIKLISGLNKPVQCCFSAIEIRWWELCAFVQHRSPKQVLCKTQAYSRASSRAVICSSVCFHSSGAVKLLSTAGEYMASMGVDKTTPQKRHLPFRVLALLESARPYGRGRLSGRLKMLLICY